MATVLTSLPQHESTDAGIVGLLAEWVRGGGEHQEITHALLLRYLCSIEGKLDTILTNQQEEMTRMATAQEIIDRLVREVGETNAENAKLLTTVQGAIGLIQDFPAKVRAAVADALANNPTADLTPLTAMADNLDGQQATLDAANAALQTAIDSANAPAPPAPVPDQPPVAG